MGLPCAAMMAWSQRVIAESAGRHGSSCEEEDGLIDFPDENHPHEDRQVVRGHADVVAMIFLISSRSLWHPRARLTHPIQRLRHVALLMSPHLHQRRPSHLEQSGHHRCHQRRHHKRHQGGRFERRHHRHHASCGQVRLRKPLNVTGGCACRHTTTSHST